MQCPDCQRSVAAWADFCPHCGASVHTPSQSGASASGDHADVPSDTFDSRSAAASSSLTNDIFGGQSSPTEWLPVEAQSGHGWSSAAAGVAPGSGFGPNDQGVSVPGDEWSQGQWNENQWNDGQGRDGGWDQGSWDEGEPPRKSGVRGLVMAATVFLVAALLFAVWSAFRVGDNDTTTAAPTAAATDASGEASPEPSPEGASPSPEGTPSEPEPSPSESPSPSPTPVGITANVNPCGVTGDDDLSAVFAAAADTSCPFAQNVATAYRASGANGAPTTVHASSPVTGRDYAMNCTGLLPVVCVADTGATVYLTRMN